MALANIIKEVDPPVELTQAEYDALSTAQKNDGTVYFITDGNGAFQTAATTPAEDTSGGTSNVQYELQKKVEKTDVVNNFTTTQEGYVADARALKTIADNYVTETKLKLQLESNRTVGFITSDKGTFDITEAVHYGRMVIFPIGFTANTNISTYTTFGTITGPRYYPIADLNLYLVGNLSGTPTGITLQVLKDGSLRCSHDISSGQTLYCTAFWIARWENY